MENFQRIKKIGKGNFGDVLLVQRIADKKMFALKRIDLRDQNDQLNFDPQNEVKVLKSLNHPNIIEYFDKFIHGSKLCILMEYADNQDLSTKIKQHKQLDIFIDEEQILQWFAQICLAVQYLHAQKIIHRDIKVQNIFLSSNGLVKLGDFGISKILEHTTDLSQTSIGTPYYLSPEICNSIQYNHKIDIWMLGCTLYELCALQKPFLGSSINSVMQKIINDQPDPLPPSYSKFTTDLIETLLEKSPEKRPEIQKVLSMPQIQKELLKLKQLYQQLGINTFINVQRFALQIKFKSETIDLNEEEKKSSRNIHTPQSSSQKTQKSPIIQKFRENSIHVLVEQSKLQQKQYSPHEYKQNSRRTPTNSQPLISINKLESQLIVKSEQQFSGVHKNLNSLQSVTLRSQEVSENELNSPHFRQQIDFFQENQKTVNSTDVAVADHNDYLLGQKLRPYQRTISINTQLDTNFTKKDESSTVLVEQKTLMKAGTFGFGQQIFDPDAPASPNRTILFSAFLRRKLGELRFSQMKMLLEQSPDPIDLLDNQRQRIISIIGEENLDCIQVQKIMNDVLFFLKIFKFLITSSVTPPASHFRNKSAQIFNKNEDQNNQYALGTIISPINAEALRCKQKIQCNQEMQKILQDVKKFNQQSIQSLEQNQGFEVSFKNTKIAKNSLFFNL